MTCLAALAPLCKAFSGLAVGFSRIGPTLQQVCGLCGAIVDVRLSGRQQNESEADPVLAEPNAERERSERRERMQAAWIGQRWDRYMYQRSRG